MTYTFAIVLAVFIAIALLGEYLRGRRLRRKYWSRPCAGVQWRRAFPDAPKAEIRAFLQAFVDDFGLRPKERLKFRPSDRPVDVYRTIYTGMEFDDGLEWESFLRTMEKEYGVRIPEDPKWPERITLGELFAMTRATQRAG